ncbi:MAG TPA: ArsR family transcriptional regulator [Planctomycetota bacterium]|nr:ArsR family transcriptional regulator [Planctomycetota bacterium]
MTLPRRISADEARKDVVDGRAILVSGYPRPKYDSWHLEGAMRLEDFEAKAPALDRNQEIVFYCA